MCRDLNTTEFILIPVNSTEYDLCVCVPHIFMCAQNRITKTCRQCHHYLHSSGSTAVRTQCDQCDQYHAGTCRIKLVSWGRQHALFAHSSGSGWCHSLQIHRVIDIQALQAILALWQPWQLPNCNLQRRTKQLRKNLTKLWTVICSIIVIVHLCSATALV